MLIGISGTGKTTLARCISRLSAIPLHHMDRLIWADNWARCSLDAIDSELQAILRTDAWIVEGWIDSYSQKILEAADLVIYLDYSGWLALWGGLKRGWRHRVTPRPELPAGCCDSLRLKALLALLRKDERPRIERFLATWAPANLVRCRSRSEAAIVLGRMGLCERPSRAT